MYSSQWTALESLTLLPAWMMLYLLAALEFPSFCNIYKYVFEDLARLSRSWVLYVDSPMFSYQAVFLFSFHFPDNLATSLCFNPCTRLIQGVLVSLLSYHSHHYCQALIVLLPVWTSWPTNRLSRYKAYKRLDLSEVKKTISGNVTSPYVSVLFFLVSNWPISLCHSVGCIAFYFG